MKQFEICCGDQTVLGETFTVGSPRGYLERLKSVTDAYSAALMDPKNRSISGAALFRDLTDEGLRDNFEFIAQAENLNLSLLNKSAADSIYAKFRDSALGLQQAFDNLGMPALSLPSESPYKHFLRYIVDPFSGGDPKNGIHPMTLNLMRTSYNPTHDATNIEDIGTGRNRMRSAFSLERLHERTKKFFPEGLPTSYEDAMAQNADGKTLKPMNHLAFDKGKTYTVITWDTETTGLTAESQIREIALVKRTVTHNLDGTMTSSAPEILTSKSFSSDLMNLAGYINEKGISVPLSEAAFIAEKGGIANVSKEELIKFRSAYEDGGAGAVKSFKDVLKYFVNEGDILGTGLGTEDLTKYLRIEGHNAEAFDLDKLITTLQRLPAFQEDAEAKNLLKKFLRLRSSKADYMLDTLDSAGIAMQIQRSELQRVMQNSGLELSEDLQHGLLSSFSISPELFGGAKGTESLENLFLNTNFFELLETKTTKEEIDILTTLMQTRGTHTAEIDATLNAYISDYINNNELHIRRLPTAGMPPSGLTDAAAAEYTAKVGDLEELFKKHGFMKKERSITAFEKFMRARIRRSSAVTPITNISDMSRISDNVFNFLKTDEGMQKISMSVTPDYLARLESKKINLGIKAENLSVPDTLPNTMDNSSAGKIYYDPERGKYVFSNFESRGLKGFGGFQELDNKVVKEAFKFALDESKEGKKELLNLGNSGSILVNQSTEALSNIRITEIEATELDQMIAARNTLDNLGTPRSLPTDATGLSKALGTTSEFYVNKTGQFIPAIVGTDKMADYSKALIDRGLPYATYDVRSRIMATAEAKATANIGQKIINEMSRAGDSTYASLVGDTKDLEKLSDIGIQFSMAQGKDDFFGLKRITKNGQLDTVDNSYFRTPVTNTPKKAGRVIINADDLSELVIREFNDPADTTSLITNEIKFGSKEFIENENLNRFIDSTVQGSTSDVQPTINRAFAPKNISRATTEDLAEQVLAGNIRAYDKLKSNNSFISTALQEEATALTRNIFGDQNLIGTDLTERMQQLAEVSNLATREARETQLRAFAGKADPNDVIRNYQQTVGTVADSIEETFITGMKITGEDAVNAINESRLIQGLSGTADTDVALANRPTRIISTMGTEDRGVLGYMMSGSVTDDMDAAARRAVSLPGEAVNIGVARATEDAAARAALIDSGKMVEKITTVVPGLNEGEKIANNAVAVGRRIYESNKGKFALGALALAAAVVGSKIAKKGNENDLYDATMQRAPVEEKQRSYGIQEALMGNGQTSRRKDPLFTAGIVGNLDRQKIGHTSMGSNKNSHLFGDQ